MTMSASAIQWKPAARAQPVDRGDHRLPHLLVPRGEVEVPVLDRLAGSAPCRLPSVAISVTSTPVWNARPSPVCTITRTSGSASSSFHAHGELVAHLGRSSR